MASVLLEDDIKGHATAVIVVLDIFPQIMREMIVNNFPPKGVSRQIQNEPNQTFKKQLTPTEKNMISKLDVTGYNDLDISCLYKIIRNFNLLPSPNQGWGQKPKPEDQSEGDDVERMKSHRNDILHRPRGGLPESEKKKFFQESIEIAKRMDKRIGSPKNGFQSRIEAIKSYHVSRQKYIEAIEKCAEFQERLHEISKTPSFELHYGNDIKIRINNKEIRGDRSTSCTLYLKDPDFDVNDIIKRLDEIKEIMRKESYDISLDGAEIGSLILHVKILDRCFYTKKVLHKAIQSFVQQFFQIAHIRCRKTYTLVLAESDNFVAERVLTKRNNFGCLEENSLPILKLNVNVKNSAFEDDLVLYREVGRFITGMYSAVDRNDIPVNGSAREVLMLTNEEKVFSSSEANQNSQLSASISYGYDESTTVGCLQSNQMTKSGEFKKSMVENEFGEIILPMEQETTQITKRSERSTRAGMAQTVFPYIYDRPQIVPDWYLPYKTSQNQNVERPSSSATPFRANQNSSIMSARQNKSVRKSGGPPPEYIYPPAPPKRESSLNLLLNIRKYPTRPMTQPSAKQGGNEHIPKNSNHVTTFNDRIRLNYVQKDNERNAIDPGIKKHSKIDVCFDSIRELEQPPLDQYGHRVRDEKYKVNHPEQHDDRRYTLQRLRMSNTKQDKYTSQNIHYRDSANYLFRKGEPDTFDNSKPAFKTYPYNTNKFDQMKKRYQLTHDENHKSQQGQSTYNKEMIYSWDTSELVPNEHYAASYMKKLVCKVFAKRTLEHERQSISSRGGSGLSRTASIYSSA
ncbi:Hypothetical predicted protein [Mytilus galloprovincialis]|uniref:DZIP3-like HEPN domain-containing protein n=1 Tax=Mytilus galloprovincialis TaxID=29158 RepID=A0A8B6C880_MYTGA|nr:Hypothetical predicted protein [Mytilus galloprovincialis]